MAAFEGDVEDGEPNTDDEEEQNNDLSDFERNAGGQVPIYLRQDNSGAQYLKEPNIL